MINKLIKWASIQIKESKFLVHLLNSKDISDPIVRAVKDIEFPEIPEINTKQITEPIVEAQKLTTAAIKAIPATIIPEVDYSSLEGKLDALKTAIEEKDMSVNVGKTRVDVDTKSVVKAIEKLELKLPELKQQEITDYTLMFDEMMKIMERPFDNTEIKKIQKLIENLATTSDMAVIGEWLKVISERPQFDLSEYLEDGKLPVKVDRVGGEGGGGLTSLETGYLKTLSEGGCNTELIARIGDVEESPAAWTVLERLKSLDTHILQVNSDTGLIYARQADGNQITKVADSGGNTIDPAKEDGNLATLAGAVVDSHLQVDVLSDPLASYKPAGMDVAANPYYFGYLDIDGKWFIKKLDTTSGTTYVKGDSDYATAWTGRTGLSYGEFNDVF